MQPVGLVLALPLIIHICHRYIVLIKRYKSPYVSVIEEKKLIEYFFKRNYFYISLNDSAASCEF